MTPRLVLLAALLTAAPALAQVPPPGAFKITERATPPLAMGEFALYPDRAPLPATEQWMTVNGDPVARNVTHPTLTAFLPDPAKATGAAAIVAPGGAYYMLAMKSEGSDVAQWLADHGIAAFVLKYTLDPTPRDIPGMMATAGKRLGALSGPHVIGNIDVSHKPQAVDDAKAALKLIRSRAGDWKIDPARVGMIGFSAGAMTVLDATLASSPAEMPAFTASIYPPMNTVPVPAHASPLFVALAADDPLFGGRGFGLVQSWQTAGRPVELHYFQRGDHGFGLGRPGTTTTLVMEEFRLWLQTNGVLGK
uniref:alpha/beta hydrolase n=1 Tax=uncultured Sphingomonas sp. TaxID=158754 RepID=UPI0035CAEDCE